jgi:hypothetical protein
VGLDSDPGILTIAAEKLLPGENKKVELLEESISNVDTVLMEDEFSLITCLGNTLPHLILPGELPSACEKIRDLLETQGVFVFQTINYDRILDKGLRGLPTIVRGEISFERFYSLPNPEGLLSFDSILTDPEKDCEIKNSALLLPVRKAFLQDILSSAGFKTIEWYGDYSGIPWSSESFLTIGVCSL